MGNIGCNINSCTHNKENVCCYSGNLNIELNNSATNNTTLCSSYLNMADNSFTNTVESKLPNNQSIKCNVKQCIHNEDNMCGLDGIFVSGNSAATNEVETKCMDYSEI